MTVFPATVAYLRVRLSLTKPLARLGSSRIMNDPCSNLKHCPVFNLLLLHCSVSVVVWSVWSRPGPPEIVRSLICSICMPFNLKPLLQALQVHHKGNIFIATLPKSNCICTSQFKRPLKDLSGDLCSKPGGNWVRLQPIEHHDVWKVNENSSLWVDVSSQESSSPLPGVASSLLVSIKDDELEREGEERASTDAEDEGHKNDEADCVRALMGHARREGGQKEEPGTFKRGFPPCLWTDMNLCVHSSDTG